MGKGRPWQGEACWSAIVTAWKASGVSARRFCREQGLAVSTLNLWRKTLSGSVKEHKPPLALTADAAFIASNLDDEWAPQLPAVTLPAAGVPVSRDRVTLSLAGVRIELSGVHAEPIRAIRARTTRRFV
jgi:hypothetical protein